MADELKNFCTAEEYEEYYGKITKDLDDDHKVETTLGFVLQFEKRICIPPNWKHEIGFHVNKVSAIVEAPTKKYNKITTLQKLHDLYATSQKEQEELAAKLADYDYRVIILICECNAICGFMNNDVRLVCQTHLQKGPVQDAYPERVWKRLREDGFVVHVKPDNSHAIVKIKNE